jgi:hypothetical protein
MLMPTLRSLAGLRIVLIATYALVYAMTGGTVAQTPKTKRAPEPTVATDKAKPAATNDELPPQVQEMRDGIEAAVKSGRIEDLQTPIAWNELPPTFADGKVSDPIEYWKQQSGDGRGLEILAILGSILAAGHAVLPVGRDVENNRLFVWPRFAEQPLDKLSAEDEVQLYRLITPAQLKTMREKKRWTWYRLAIGADGTWHAFSKSD